MDKKFVMGIAAMAALTLVSCSSDDLDSFSDNSSKNEAISFDGYLGRSAVAVNGTRGSEETKETLKTKGFGVFGNYIADAGQTSDANFFKNQKVTYSGTKWTYTPLKYWPTNGHIDFLAYAPYDANTALKKTTETSGAEQKNTSCIDFTVADKAANQIDLLWANATGQIKTNFEGTTKEKVKFQFHHALSRLGYTVKLSGNYSSDNATFTLKKITLAGSPDETKNAFYKKGTIDLSKTNTATGLWTAALDNNKQNFTWFDGSYIVKNSDPKHPTNSEDKDYSDKDYLFVIPQDFSQTKTEEHDVDELYVIVEYNVAYKSESGTPTTTITNKVYKKLPINFLQGKAYKLNLTIGLPIEFDVDVDTVNGVDPWDEVNDVPGDINSWDDISRK